MDGKRQRHGYVEDKREHRHVQYHVVYEGHRRYLPHILTSLIFAYIG